MGHNVASIDGAAVGGFQSILVMPNTPAITSSSAQPGHGFYRAGSDPRKDGQAVGWEVPAPFENARLSIVAFCAARPLPKRAPPTAQPGRGSFCLAASVGGLVHFKTLRQRNHDL